MLGNICGNHYKFFNWEDTSLPQTHVEDITFECLMTGLSEQRMKEYFYKRDGADQHGQHAAGDESGISVLLKGLMPDDDFKELKIDEFIFDPFGYSMNAIFGKNYYTIHVTPQDVCSYASFETNLKLETYSILTERLMEIFKPEQFMTIIVDTPPGGTKLTEKDSWSQLPTPKDFIRNERCQYEFDKYTVSYCSYCTPAVANMIRQPSPKSTPTAKYDKVKDVADPKVGDKDVKEKELTKEYKVQPVDVPDKVAEDTGGPGNCVMS